MTQLNEAIVNFHKADRLEKQAKELRGVARAVIVAELKAGTIKAGKHSYGETTIEITQPMAKGRPAEFDQTRAMEFRVFCEDTYGSLLPAFKDTVTTTVDIQVLFALMKAVDADKTSLLSKVEDFIIPASEDIPMEPRVRALK